MSPSLSRALPPAQAWPNPGWKEVRRSSTSRKCMSYASSKQLLYSSWELELPVGGRPALTLHAPSQLVYPKWLRDIEGCPTPLCLLRQLGFACGENRGDVRLTGVRVGPLCRSTSLQTYSQHETTKDAPQSMTRVHHLHSSSSPLGAGEPLLHNACPSAGYTFWQRHILYHSKGNQRST